MILIIAAIILRMVYGSICVVQKLINRTKVGVDEAIATTPPHRMVYRSICVVKKRINRTKVGVDEAIATTPPHRWFEAPIDPKWLLIATCIVGFLLAILLAEQPAVCFACSLVLALLIYCGTFIVAIWKNLEKSHGKYKKLDVKDKMKSNLYYIFQKLAPEDGRDLAKVTSKAPIAVLGSNENRNHADNTGFLENYRKKKTETDYLESFQFQGIQYYALNLVDVPQLWKQYVHIASAVMFVIHNNGWFEHARDALHDLVVRMPYEAPLAIVLEHCDDPRACMNVDVQRAIGYDEIVLNLGSNRVEMFRTSEANGGYDDVLRWITSFPHYQLFVRNVDGNDSD